MNKAEQIKALKVKIKNKDLDESLYKLNTIRDTLHKKWGKERMLNLISPELLTRFRRAQVKYREEYNNAKNQIALNEMMVRAYKAIEEDLINQGYKYLEEDYIFIQNTKTKENFIICKNNDQLELAYNKYKNENVIILSLQELLLIINNDFIKIKKAFHKFGASIKKYESKNRN